MKKSWFYIIVTIIIEFGLSFGASQYFNTALIPIMFFIGLFSMGLILYFTSSGGILSTYNDATAQAQTGILIKARPSETKLKGSPALWGSCIYFLISLFLFILY